MIVKSVVERAGPTYDKALSSINVDRANRHFRVLSYDRCQSALHAAHVKPIA